MAFNVDNTTMVEARGGSTKSARLAASGKPGPHLAELLKAGQAVAVTYSDMAGNFHASDIKAIPKRAERRTRTLAASNPIGVVKAIGPDWITINGSSGGQRVLRADLQGRSAHDGLGEGRQQGRRREGRQGAVHRPRRQRRPRQRLLSHAGDSLLASNCT